MASCVHRNTMKTKLRTTLCLFAVVLLLLAAGDGVGKIFYSKKEALALAFGKEAQVEMMSLFLTDKQIEEIQRRAKVKVDSAMFTFYVGKRNEQLLGYAAIETHTVRTRPETLLIVLSPEGELRRIEVLAFHEPPEYQPPARWFEQLYRRPFEALDFNKEIQGITGATLSSRSALDIARKVLAVYQIAAEQEED
jgi:FMN-binding domain